jgi:hypothetical protein|tara:strand:+ start:120 stop:362 length:243 start_codon:yes stop_codon:yes gene_type:complete
MLKYVHGVPVEDYDEAMREHFEHTTLVDCCEIINKHGLQKVLASLADYCNEPVAQHALMLMSKAYKENEFALRKNAPRMQ